MARFFVKDIQDGKDAVIRGSEFYHLTKVLRLQEGDSLSIFDGKGKEFEALIEAVTEREAVLKLLKSLGSSNESPLNIIIAQGIPKADKMDYIIQKATELGVSGIIPLITSRTVPVLKGDRALRRRSRFRKIALEAAKQCGRKRLPEVADITLLKDLLSSSNLPDMRLILWEGETDRGLKEVLKERPPENVICLIGPEGGFSEEEVSTAIEKGFVPVTMGKRILKTETASLAFLSIIQYEWGDMGRLGLP